MAGKRRTLRVGPAASETDELSEAELDQVAGGTPVVKTSKDGEAPGVDFAGAGRTVPWATGYC
jgi:hypothetical protein